MRAALLFACGALVVLLSLYLLVRANAAWTPHPRFFPDDALYARMCFPDGFAVYWNDFGFYRLLAVPAYALSNRAVMRASLSPVPYTLIALAFATVVFVCACVSAGLSRRRGALLAGVLLSSPILVETLNFWSGTFNYALVLLLLAAQLRVSMWAHRSGKPARGYAVVACAALLALLTYEIALPFILASGAFYAHGWPRRLASVGIASVASVAFVAALAGAGLYWPQRFKLAAEQLTSVVSGAGKAETKANTNPAANASAIDHAGVSAGAGNTPRPAPPAPSATGRARMYVSLLFSFINTGLRRSPLFWALVITLAGLTLLSRPAGKLAAEGRLPRNLMASAFAFAFVACVGYLVLTRSANARYAAFLLIYGAATLAWTKARVAGYALASLLLVQAAVAASLPIHMRDVEAAAKGGAGEPPAAAASVGDLVSVEGRLARASWGKRFHAPPAVDMLAEPLNPRACRYTAPCEECK
ncbi:MAG TPA: hypothetical protein VEX70_07290 [Pyrinomonadaceae bacterium]|nr:hypothetical protein [Pyrinomonadaceae bacterium]